MFEFLDATIANLLTAAPPAALHVPAVSFRTPDPNFNPPADTVNVFLYGVHENRTLRDPEPIVTLANGQYSRRLPPVRVDCDYLVTAWPQAATNDAAVVEEHQMLAHALAKLSAYQVVPTNLLDPGLAAQPFPIQLWVGQSDDTKSLGEFWSALGVPPRSSFLLTATVALDLPLDTPLGPPVASSEIRLGEMGDPEPPKESSFTIGVTVRDAATLAPVPGAVVTLDGGPSAETGADGLCRLVGIGAGNRQLRTVALGFAPDEQTVAVPAAAPDDYLIDLGP